LKAILLDKQTLAFTFICSLGALFLYAATHKNHDAPWRKDTELALIEEALLLHGGYSMGIKIHARTLFYLRQQVNYLSLSTAFLGN